MPDWPFDLKLDDPGACSATPAQHTDTHTHFEADPNFLICVFNFHTDVSRTPLNGLSRADGSQSSFNKIAIYGFESLREHGVPQSSTLGPISILFYFIYAGSLFWFYLFVRTVLAVCHHLNQSFHNPYTCWHWGQQINCAWQLYKWWLPSLRTAYLSRLESGPWTSLKQRRRLSLFLASPTYLSMIPQQTFLETHGPFK